MDFLDSLDNDSGGLVAPWDKIVPVEEIDPELFSSFSCGDQRMDNWFLTKALNWCYLGFCQVFIAVGRDGIVGFFSLSPISISPDLLSNRQRHGKNSIEYPGLLLGRIAVRSDYQGSRQHVGTLLLKQALLHAHEISKAVGGRFIILDAKTPELARWYARYGFRHLKSCELRMILPMKDVPSVLGGVDKL